MKSIVLKTRVRDFMKEAGYNEQKVKNDEDNAFQLFSVYTVFKTFFNLDLDEDDANITDGGGDSGIDAVLFSLDGMIVYTVEDVEDYFKNSGDQVRQFDMVIVQCKNTPSIKVDKYSGFKSRVLDFFSEESEFEHSRTVDDVRNVLNEILKHIAKIEKRKLSVFYVYSGDAESSQDVQVLQNQLKKEIDALSLFSDESISATLINGPKLLKLFEQSSSDDDIVTINVPKQLNLPSISNVDEAVIGYVAMDEFLKLISDKNRKYKESVVEGNVRAYQGLNRVNQQIADTLAKESEEEDFVLFNNGVTLIAEKINKRRDDFIIKNYQIVNGGQTAYTIFSNQDVVKDQSKVFLPLKIIVSSDESLVNRIIIANNSQTEVKKEELESLTDVQKKIEEFYTIFPENEDYRLYYERRSNQYNGKSVQKVRIVSIQNQLKSSASMFFNYPHLANRYYGRLFSRTFKDVFKPGRPEKMYYASAISLYRLEYLFRTKVIDGNFRIFRFHLLMVIKYLILLDKGKSLKAIDNLPEKGGDSMFDAIINTMIDDEKAAYYANEGIKLIKIKQGVPVESSSRKDTATGRLTEFLKTECASLEKTK